MPLNDNQCRTGKCAFVLDDPESGAGHRECVPDGVLPVGSPCEPPTLVGEWDRCVRDSHCYGGECTQACRSDECAPGETCIQASPEYYRRLCRPACNPVAQDCPPAADGQVQGCFIGFWGPGCVIPYRNDGALDDPCATWRDCEAGTTCSAGVDSHCEVICDPADCAPDGGVPDCPPCPGAETCLHLQNTVYGFCSVP